MKNNSQKNNVDKNMNSTLLEFIEKYDLDYELVGWYRNTEGKKEVCRPASDKKTKSVSEIIRKFKWLADNVNSEFYVAYLINIKNTPIANIDIDEDIDLETIYKKYTFSKNTLILEGNTKGFHILVQNEDL